MYKGFEAFHPALTDVEKKVVPILIAQLRKGKDNAITNAQIQREISTTELRLTPERIRKLITHIRLKNLAPGLIATSDGYYIATSRQELEDYCESLKHREKAIAAIRVVTEQHLFQSYGSLF